MTTFKIASWNVNSLRVRLPHVLAWLETVKPDVLALQETKLIDSDFPAEVFQQLGYKIIFSGQKTYNGVAIISRYEIADVVTDFPLFDDHQRRVLAVTTHGIRILNLYIPNGESLTSTKYQYKLNWLKILNNFVQNELKQSSQLIILGDFNIAPENIDVYDPAAWQNSVLFSEPERTAFQQLLQLGLVDCYREKNPTEKSFTWWDYRLNAFKRNMGLRIDHILADHKTASQCISCYIDKSPRTWERPSDHAPIVAEYNEVPQS